MILKTSKETKQFGKNFAQKVKRGGIICLYGDLGSGKTTFTQGLAEGVGVSNRIISPTFVIIRTYEIKDFDQKSTPVKPGSKNFYHIDLYRLSSEKELTDLGLKEILENSENIVVIEWAEKLVSLLPKKRWDICFSYTGDKQRDANVTQIP